MSRKKKHTEKTLLGELDRAVKAGNLSLERAQSEKLAKYYLESGLPEDAVQYFRRHIALGG